MNWWHRGEERYIEYGTSFGASRAFGIRQSLTDTIYNMNLEHLSQGRRDGVRAPRRRRDPHRRHDLPDVPRAPPARAVGRHGARRGSPTRCSGCRRWGPKELFYADLFASRKTPAARSSGCPGVRDQHSGCVSEYMVEHDLFDFLLLSLPDNDTHSHKYGPFAQVDSIAAADRQIARMMEPAGGPEKFLEDHAVIVCSRPLAVQGRGRDRPLQGVRRLRPARRPALARRRRDRGLPELARRAGLRARPRQAALADPARRADAAGARGRRPRDADGRPPGRRGDRPRRALARRQGGALRAARRPRRRPRRALERRGRPRPARPEDRGRPDPLGDLPGRDEPRLVARCAARRPARCWPPPARATSSSTGAARTTSAAARTARCTPTTPTRSLLWTGTGPEKSAREQWALRDIVPMITQHFGLS